MRFMTIYKPGFERDTPPTEKEMAGCSTAGRARASA